MRLDMIGPVYAMDDPTDYAASIVDSPILSKQTRVLPFIEVIDRPFLHAPIRQDLQCQVTVAQQTPQLEIMTLAPESKPTSSQ